MTNAADIDVAIASGNYERAAVLAARFENPAEHRNAMIRIFNARQAKGRPMKFELENATAGTVHYLPRRELHGEDPEPAATLTFDVELPASLLAMFSPTLRWSIFHNPNKTTNGGAAPVDDATVLRYPQWKNPIKWERDIVGGTLTIHRGIGGDESDIVLPAKKVDDFQITPKDGGAFGLHFRVACRPDERQSGALAMMQDEPCEFSFEPPEAAVGDLADQAMREPAGADA